MSSFPTRLIHELTFSLLLLNMQVNLLKLLLRARMVGGSWTTCSLLVMTGLSTPRVTSKSSHCELEGDGGLH